MSKSLSELKRELQNLEVYEAKESDYEIEDIEKFIEGYKLSNKRQSRLVLFFTILSLLIPLGLWQCEIGM